MSPYATQAAQSAYANRRYHADPVAQVKHREVTRATKGLHPRQLYLAVGLEPYEAALETMVERVPADKGTARWFEQWKQFRRDGWDVSVLVSPDRKTLVGLACRNGERWRFVEEAAGQSGPHTQDAASPTRRSPTSAPHDTTPTQSSRQPSPPPVSLSQERRLGHPTERPSTPAAGTSCISGRTSACTSGNPVPSGRSPRSATPEPGPGGEG